MTEFVTFKSLPLLNPLSVELLITFKQKLALFALMGETHPQHIWTVVPRAYKLVAKHLHLISSPD